VVTSVSVPLQRHQQFAGDDCKRNLRIAQIHVIRLFTGTKNIRFLVKRGRQVGKFRSGSATSGFELHPVCIMVHRAQDSRLLAQVLKVDKEYSSALNGLLLSSQASLAALNAYASSCPPNHAQAMLSVVSALSGADEALRAYLLAVDAWRTDLKRVRRSEEEIGTILRDREIL